jgi:hypothetical protein
MRFVFFAAYVAIGALCHLQALGPHFDLASTTTWCWLLGWPFLVILELGILLWAFAKIGLLPLLSVSLTVNRIAEI